MRSRRTGWSSGRRIRHDGRRVLVRATAKGKRVLWRGRERRVERLAGLLGRLSAEEVATIHAAAELVESALAQEP